MRRRYGLGVAVRPGIDDVLARLDEPLDPRDAEAGWTEELRLRWRERLAELGAAVAAGDTRLDDTFQLTRWLQFDGIAGGPRADAIADLQQELTSAYGRRRLRVPAADAVRFLHQLSIRR